MKAFLATVCLLLSVGCAAAPNATAPIKPWPTTASPTYPATLTSAPSPTATTPACLSLPGRVIVDEYVDSDLARSIPYRVYLPPCYEEGSSRTYPILILLHGLQLTDSQWDDLGVDETADTLLRQGRIPPMVIVMPWERKGLDFEQAIVAKLLPHIRSAYAGGGNRTTTAIGGISRGAGWALRIGLKHPDEFGAIGLHSPAVLEPDLFYLADWTKAAEPDVPRLWIDIASRDTSRAGAQELAGELRALGVTFASSIAPGEHTASYWSSRLKDYLTWYALGWTGSRMR